jgi:hypothetical protein
MSKVQNRSGVGRLLLYGVHRGVSRAAVHRPDLAMTCLYSTAAHAETLEKLSSETAPGEARSGLPNKTGH